MKAARRNRSSEAHVLLQQLSRAIGVRFTSRSRCVPVLTIRGSGETGVERRAGGVTIEESGEWRDGRGGRAKFRNLSRWTANRDGGVCIEHLRHGPDRPVVVVELVRQHDQWQSIAPHACGEDLYTAAVRTDARGVHVRWRIRGPSKAMILGIHYTTCTHAGER